MSPAVTAEWQSSPLRFVTQALLAAFGTGTPREQMVFSLLLAAGAYVSTLFSLGATAILVVVFTVTFLIGVVRWVLATLGG